MEICLLHELAGRRGRQRAMCVWNAINSSVDICIPQSYVKGDSAFVLGESRGHRNNFRLKQVRPSVTPRHLAGLAGLPIDSSG